MFMWPKAYKDYKTDESLVKYQVQPGKGARWLRDA